MSISFQNQSLKFQSNLVSVAEIAPSLATVQDFLDSAILAAWRDVFPVSTAPALSPIRWLWRLAGSYHTTHDTPRLLRQAAERFVAAGRWELAQWASERANEEQGHDQLALLDIQGMGYEPKMVINRLVPPTAIELISYFSQQIEAIDPIGCVGYSYVLERLATRIEESTIKNIEAMLPPGTKATRCLRVHSNIGADAHHVRENVETIAKLTLAEQRNIAIACYETAKLCFTPPKGGYISEHELRQKLEASNELLEVPGNNSSADVETVLGTTAISQNPTPLPHFSNGSSETLDILLKSQLQKGLPSDQDNNI